MNRERAAVYISTQLFPAHCKASLKAGSRKNTVQAYNPNTPGVGGLRQKYYTQVQGQTELFVHNETLSPCLPPHYYFWKVYMISKVRKLIIHSPHLSCLKGSQQLTGLTRGNKGKLGLVISHFISTSEGKRILEEHGLYNEQRLSMVP